MPTSKGYFYRHGSSRENRCNLPQRNAALWHLDFASDRFRAEFQNYVTINFPNNVKLLVPKSDATKKGAD